MGQRVISSITVKRTGKRSYIVESGDLVVGAYGVEGALRASITMLSRALFDSACEDWRGGLIEESVVEEAKDAHNKIAEELD